MSDRPVRDSDRNSIIGKQPASPAVAEGSNAPTLKPQSREPLKPETIKSSSGSSVAGTRPTDGEQHVEVGTELGYYRLLNKLGEGGMGSVWQAVHTKLDKHVAVKVLPATWSRDPALLTRFEREMKAVGKLEHPNIVRAMDAGEFNGTHYLVMEFNEGLDLSAYVKQRGPQSVTNACEMLRHAAIGLAHAHEAGLIHRDIKPSNLFLTKTGKVKILDLGLARVQGDTSGGGQTLTGFGQVLGTPDYMAPEQWENTHSVDGRSDLYALGCTLFYLLTGRAPFSDEKHSSLVGKMKGHTLDPIPDLKAARIEAVANRPKLIFDLISDDLDGIYRRLMAKQPEARFESATELANALIPFGKQGAGTSAVLVKGRSTADETRSVVPSSPVAPRQESRTSLNAISATDSPQKSNVPRVPGNPVAERQGYAAATPLIMTQFEPASPSEPSGTGDAPTFLAMFSGDSSPTQHDARASGSSISQSQTELDHSLARRAGDSKLKLGWIAGGVAAIVLLVGVTTFFFRGKGGSIEPVDSSNDEVATEVTVKKKARKVVKADSDSQPVRLTTKEEPKPNTSSADTDRSLAEWVLSLPGSQIEIGDDCARVANRDALPTTPFQVRSILIVALDRVTDADFLRLRGIARLDKLTFSGIQSRITDQGITNLAEAAPISLREVVFLNETPNLSDTAILQFNRLGNLLTLGLHSQGITNAGLAQLSLPKLQSLGLTTKATPSGLKGASSRMPALNALSFQGVVIPANELPLLEEFKLQTLWLEQTELRNDDLPLLHKLVALQSLTIKVNPEVTDAGTHHLLAFKELRHLELADAGIGDPTCETLKMLPELTSISIRHTRLSDAGIASLSELPKLKALWITGSAAVTDAGLETLSKRQTIEDLAIDGCPKLTVAGIRKLQAAIPNCRITSDFTDLSKTPQTSEPSSDSKPMPKEVAGLTPNKTAPITPPKTNSAELLADVERPQALKIPVSATKVDVPATLPKPKSGQPISVRQIVTKPASLKDLASWSIEPVGHLGGIIAVAWSPNGEFILSAGQDDALRLWRVEAGAKGPELRLHRLLLGERGGIQDAQFSPDGRTVAVVTFYGHQLALHDVATGRRLNALELKGATGRTLQWTTDGKQILSSHAPMMGIVDPVKSQIRMVDYNTNSVDAAWSADERTFVTMDEGGKIRWIDAINMKVIGEAELNTGRVGNGSLDWSPDGQLIAFGCHNDAIQLWDAYNRRKAADLVGHQTGGAPVLFVGFEPNRKRDVSERHEAWPRLVSACGSELIVWNIATRQPLARMRSGGQIFKAAWSPDGKWIAAAGYNRLAIYDAGSGQEVAVNDTGRGDLGGTVHLSSNGKTLRLHHGSTLLAWNADTGESTQRLTEFPSGASLASPNDQWLAVYDSQQEKDNLWIVDSETGLQRAAMRGHFGGINAVNWSPDSKQLASAGSDKTVRLWNISDGQQVQKLDHDRAVRSLIWSPDGQQLATCADDDIVRIWSIGKKAPTSRSFDRLPSPVAIGPFGMAWSSDGKLIALAAADAGARVLDVKSGKLSEPFINFVAGMQCVAWSSDSKQILAANGWEVGYRAVTAKESAVVNGLGAPVFWHPDKRRFVTGCWGGYPIQSFDTRKVAKLGTLIPRFGTGAAHWVCIGPDGHFRGSENVESQLVVVAISKDGGQKLYSTADFSEKYGWKNDPAKARLMKLDEAGGK